MSWYRLQTFIENWLLFIRKIGRFNHSKAVVNRLSVPSIYIVFIYKWLVQKASEVELARLPPAGTAVQQFQCISAMSWRWIWRRSQIGHWYTVLFFSNSNVMPQRILYIILCNLILCILYLSLYWIHSHIAHLKA